MSLHYGRGEGYDPIALTELVASRVAPWRGNVRLRRYYRFRVDRWYGGVVTGDVVGCNLRCKFCWAWRFTWTGYDKGILLSPQEAALKLIRLAQRKAVRAVRLSGGEPTIGWEHLLGVIEKVVESGLEFILETNGLLIGYYEELARKLASFHGSGVEVRVSLKGTSEEEFKALTGARGEGWRLQLKALQLLIQYGLEPCEEVYAAVMLSFTDDRGVKRVKEELKSIDARLAKCIDPEYVILYPHVVRLLRMTGLKPRIAYTPDNIPKELI